MRSELGVWVYIESTWGDIEDSSLEALAKGKRIADQLSTWTGAVVVGNQSPETVRVLSELGAESLVCIDCCELQDPGRPFEIETLIHALVQFFVEHPCRLILFSASISGNDIACRLAPKIDAALFTNCTDITADTEQNPLYNKPAHGGRVAATYACVSSASQIATILPGLFEKKKFTGRQPAQVVRFSPRLKEQIPRLKRIGLVKADPEKIRLDEADIIVSGGRGLGSDEGFDKLRELSRAMGGTIGASLGAVDDGLAERRHLVGQTGTTVAPQLYLACGISGSIYHVLGMKDSKAIVAINKDRHAEIFKYADMGIVGDAGEIIDAIKDRLTALAKTSES